MDGPLATYHSTHYVWSSVKGNAHLGPASASLLQDEIAAWLGHVGTVPCKMFMRGSTPNASRLRVPCTRGVAHRQGRHAHGLVSGQT